MVSAATEPGVRNGFVSARLKEKFLPLERDQPLAIAPDSC